jgi:hypothetical protein
MKAAARGSLAAATLFSSLAAAVENLSISGANFVSNATGDRFDIIGVTLVVQALDVLASASASAST